jgi:membrane protein YqaA with SNARE-associated domain
MEVIHSIMDFMRGLVDWTIAWSTTPHATVALTLIAFAESSFFPVPPDLLLIPMALGSPASALWFATVCTAASTCGGMFGYFLGIKGGRPLMLKLFAKEKIIVVEEYYKKYDVWAVGIAALTPIPYKVFTISAGVFDLDFKRFVLVSIVGRGARFYLVATLIMFFGPAVKGFLDKNFELTVSLFAILLVGGFYVVSHLGKRASRQKQEAVRAKELVEE